MQWKTGESSVSLTSADLSIMRQCKMPLDEIMRSDLPVKNIPPLWSVLSYAMLRRNCAAAGVWAYYRSVKKMAENTSRYYYCCQIPKASGGVRELYVPNFFLKKEQEFIMDKILSELPVDSHAYAYQKGVCCQDCAVPHVQKDVLIHLDLKNFFGSISEDMVYETLLAETGYTKALCRFLAQICCLHGSLPQGTVTSPMLSNIVFRRCDVALVGIAKKYQLAYSRYSDDLFFSGAEDVDVKAVLKDISGTLRSFGFKLNTEKTKIRRPQHRQSVLGLTVNDRIQVNRDYRRKLLQELYYLERFGKKCQGAIECGDYLKYMQQLQGRLAYVMHIDPNNSKLWEAHMNLTLRINRYAFLCAKGFVE